MKKMKKFLSLSVAAVLALSMTACGSKAGDTQNADATEKSSSNAKYTVGICQLVQHEALDAATKGFKDYLTEKLGDDVVFDEQNAQGDSATCATIVNSFVSKNEDLILANATAPLQSAAAGTSDLAPLSEQAAMLNELFPDAKNVGLLYCSAEANSQYQIDVIKEELEKLNYTCTAYSFVDSNDIASVVQSAVNENDVLYVPTDNTAASNTEVINNIAGEAGIPIIAGEAGICKGCGVATLSISYYDLGYQTGKMAYEILVNGADPSTMEVEFAPAVTKQYNPDICEKLGITVPDDYEALYMSE